MGDQVDIAAQQQRTARVLPQLSALLAGSVAAQPTRLAGSTPAGGVAAVPTPGLLDCLQELARSSSGGSPGNAPGCNAAQAVAQSLQLLCGKGLLPPGLEGEGVLSGSTNRPLP